MSRDYVSDTESIASLETESEEEIETKIKPKSRKVKEDVKAEIDENPKQLFSKTGRPKRTMSEAQKANLAKARIKAREKRKELKEIRDQEKGLKKDDMLIKKLEVEAKVLEHKRRLQKLAVNAGYAKEEDIDPPVRKERKPKAPHNHLKDDDHDKYQADAILKLEAQLEELRSKSSKTKKTKIIEPESESEESEVELEIRPVVKKEKKVKVEAIEKLKTPAKNFKEDNKMKDPANPGKNIMTKADLEMEAKLNSLFPNRSGR